MPTNNYPIRWTIPVTDQMAVDMAKAKIKINDNPGINLLRTDILRDFIEDGIKKTLRK